MARTALIILSVRIPKLTASYYWFGMTLQENGAAKQIHLERLPAYTPDFIPDEGTWRHHKRIDIYKVYCFDLDHLH